MGDPVHLATGRLVERAVDSGWDTNGRKFLFLRSYNSGSGNNSGSGSGSGGSSSGGQGSDPAPYAVNYWSGDGNAFDTRGGNNASILGGVTFAPGLWGQAFQFDGSSGSLEAPSGPNLDVGTGPFSVSFWIKRGCVSPSCGTQELIGKVSLADNAGWYMYLYGEGGTTPNGISFGTRSPPNNGFGVDSSRVIADTDWHHIVATRSEIGILHLYVDGVIEPTFSHGQIDLNTPEPLRIGRVFGPAHFNGQMEHVALYKRELSQFNVNALYALQRNPPSTPPGQSAAGGFGPGWNHTWERSLVDAGPQGVYEVDGRGVGLLFPRDGGSGFLPPAVGGATLTHDADGGWTVTRFDKQVNHYLPSLKLDYAQDANGGRYQVGYTPDGAISTITDPSGQQYQLEVANGLIQSLTAKNGYKVQYGYNDGRLATVTDVALGNTTSYGYDPVTGDLTTITDPAGNRREFTYTDGKVTRINLVALMPDGSEKASLTTIEYPSATTRQFTDPVGNPTTYEFDASGHVTNVSRADGTVLSMARDSAGRLTSLTRPDGSTQSWTYAPGGQLLAVSTPLSNATSYVIDPVTQWVMGVTYPDGTSLHYERDSAGLVVSTTDAAHRMTTFSRGSQGLITTQVDPLGRSTTMTYDANGNVATVTDAAGGVTTIQRDDLGREVARTSPGGRTTRIEYEGMRRIKATIDGAGNRTEFTYDTLGRQASIQEANGATTLQKWARINGVDCLVERTDPAGNAWKSEFDEAGRETARIDPLGRRTTMRYDSMDRVIEVARPGGDVTLMRYNQIGLLAEVENARHAVTRMFYDHDQRLVRTVQPDGLEETQAYDTRGRVVGRTNAEGSTQFTHYDAVGQVDFVVDEMGHISHMEYTRTGHLSVQRDQRDQATHFGHDLLDRQTSKTDPLGFITRHEYGLDSEMTARIDKRGERSTMAYDARLLSVGHTDPLGFTVARAYDNVGNPTTVTDENGHAWTLSWDNRHLKTSETDPNGRTTRYDYDAARQLKLVTHPDSTRWRYTHDVAGRVTARILERADGSVEDVEASSYDVVGNPLNTENAAVRVTRTFDLRDREIKRTTLFKRTGVTRELTFQYDPMGRRKAMADSHGRVAVYSYDRLSSPTEMTLFEPPTVVFAAPTAFRTRTYAFAWDPTSNLTQVAYPNGTRTRREFDNANRLTRLVNERVPTSGAPQVLSSFTYERDQNGNITKITDDRNQVFEYAYSKRNELTRARIPRSLVARLKARDDARAKCEPYREDDDDEDEDRRRGNGHGTRTDLDYRFDPAGNRIEEAREGRSILSTFSPTNELLTRDGISYLYDLRGNLIEERLRSGHRQLSRYDVANRMVSLAQSTPGHRGRGHTIQELEQYFYDPQNQRIGVRDAKKDRLTQFHWEGGRPIEEWREMARTSSGPRDKGVLYLRMAGQLLEQMRFESVAPRCDPDRNGDEDQDDERDVAFKHLDWIIPDHLGSTSVVTDSRGRRMGRALEYGPWGEPLAGKHSRSRFTYTGHQAERATGNYYSVYRYLDPWAGRWTQRDPLGDHEGANRYRYVQHRPLVLVDADGLQGSSPSVAAPVPLTNCRKTAIPATCRSVDEPRCKSEAPPRVPGECPKGTGHRKYITCSIICEKPDKKLVPVTVQIWGRCGHCESGASWDSWCQELVEKYPPRNTGDVVKDPDDPSSMFMPEQGGPGPSPGSGTSR